LVNVETTHSAAFFAVGAVVANDGVGGGGKVGREEGRVGRRERIEKEG
jgi:hypothetical protein